MTEAHTARSQGVRCQGPDDGLLVHVPQTDVAVVASSDQSLVIISDVDGGDAVCRSLTSPQSDRDDELVRESGHRATGSPPDGRASGGSPPNP